jgi:hypothetical protein
MSEVREIADVLQKIARTATSDYIKFFYATVESVDESARTCTARSLDDDSDEPLLDIQLMAEPNDGMLKIPSVGSEVIVGYNRDDNPFVICFGQLDKVICHTEVVFQFNKGENFGLAKVEALTGKLNALENKYNDLISAYNLHVHAGVTSGGSSSGPTPSTVTGTIIPTQRGEIENTKVTH